MRHLLNRLLYIGTLKLRLLAVAILCLPVLIAGGLSNKSASASPLPAPTIVATAPAACSSGFFGLESWYHFMPPDELGFRGDPCAIHCFNFFVQNKPNDCGESNSDIPGVILAIVDDLLRVAALAALAFIFAGAFKYVGSRGNSERTASAESTLLNALIGLAISLVAVAVVSFIGNKLGG